MIRHGDCVDVMAEMEAESIDAIVTDPPYGLEFMGKEWDKLGAGIEATTDTVWTDRAPGSTLPFGGGGQRVRYGTNVRSMQQWHQRWAEAAYRVAKPSAYLLAFGGTRTVHRMTVALEDAGWIIRDMLVWAYLSGFPKSRASLKPSWEPIVLARKPGPLRDLNIEDCRIPFASDEDRAEAVDKNQHTGYANPGSNRDSYSGNMPPRQDYDATGRWPANIVMTEPVLGDASRVFQIGDYPRFLVIPKADRSDREPVLGGLSGVDVGELRTMGDGAGEWTKHGPDAIRRRNVHPTVKPTELMRHLVRLVTPAGGTVLDCFAGSGSTLIAAEQEGFQWVGIEREREYVDIIEARLNGVQRGLGLDLPPVATARREGLSVVGVDPQLLLGMAGPTESDEVA